MQYQVITENAGKEDQRVPPVINFQKTDSEVNLIIFSPDHSEVEDDKENTAEMDNETDLTKMETENKDKITASAEINVEADDVKADKEHQDSEDNAESKDIHEEVITKEELKAAVAEIKEAISNAGLWFNTELRKQIHITPKGWELRGVG